MLFFTAKAQVKIFFANIFKSGGLKIFFNKQRLRNILK